MAQSLAEYAAKHPGTDPQDRSAATAATDARTRADELETATRLKAAIASHLEQGDEPQTVLYMALQCIGLLTSDKEWAEQTQQRLDSVYADLAQQSLMRDDAAIERARLDALQVDYNQRLRNSINRQLRGYEKIRRELYAVLDAVNELDPIESE